MDSDNAVVKRIVEFLSSKVKGLVCGDRHAGYANSREPIAYDYHMPPWLQLENVEHNPKITSDLTDNFIANLMEREFVKSDSPLDIDVLLATFRLRDLVPAEAIGESSVRDVLTGIHQIASPIATLSCFDIDPDDVVFKFPDFRSVFRANDSSPGPNCIADLLVTCQARPNDKPEEWGSLWSSVAPQPPKKDLRDRYFQDLYTEEYKSIRTASPRAILGIYVILWCLDKGHLERFWPRNDCDGCPKFRKSHAAMDGKETENAPLDAPDTEPPATKSEVLREEIDRLVDLALEYDEKYKIPDQTTKKRPREPKHDEKVEELKSYSQLLNEATKKAIEELEFPEIIENGMYRWVLIAAHMLIQVWSQMVRFNGTVARLTCHNIGVILTRHRDNQTLSVSNFVEHTDTPILLTTALTVYAYTDAVQRHDEHLANEEPLWIEDLYRGETRAAQKDDETSSEDEEYQQPPKNKRGGRGGRRGGGGRGIRATQKDDETSSEDEEDQQPPKNKRGGRGGRRGGGGRGSRRGGGGAGGHGRGSNDRDQGGPSGGSGGNNDNSRDGRSHQQSQDRQARLDKRNNVNANNAHLAFRARGKHLWSRGFSHFKRVEPEATAAPASNPSDLTHRSQDLPRRVYLPGFGIGSTIPDQQRRASGGSIESGGSSDSTRTSVPSLFSEQTSSVPPSPVTTSSFTNQLSRDSSPSPEKLSGHQAGSENAAATTVSDVGIVIDDVLGESAIGIVWSGKMILEDGVDDNNSISIAVKMAVPKENVDGIFGEDDREIVRHEGLVYDYLTRAAKMEISPRYYGIFEDNVGSVALILDNGGAALKDFKKLTGRQAQTLFEKAVEMHSVGVIHNDLVPRNVVQDSDGELRIIDFHVANLNHRCAGKEECEELSMFSQALGL